MRSRSFILVSGFGILYLLTNWVVPMNNVPMQTLFNIYILVMCISILNDYRSKGKELILQSFWILFFTGEIGKYIANAVIYWSSPTEVWFDNFNNLVPNVIGLVSAIVVWALYSSWKINKMKWTD